LLLFLSRQPRRIKYRQWVPANQSDLSTLNLHQAGPLFSVATPSEIHSLSLAFSDGNGAGILKKAPTPRRQSSLNFCLIATTCVRVLCSTRNLRHLLALLNGKVRFGLLWGLFTVCNRLPAVRFLDKLRRLFTVHCDRNCHANLIRRQFRWSGSRSRNGTRISGSRVNSSPHSRGQRNSTAMKSVFSVSVRRLNAS